MKYKISSAICMIQVRILRPARLCSEIGGNATMSMQRLLLIAAGLGALATATPAGAQPNDSNISLNAPGLLIKKPPPGPPDVRTTPLAWPRLEPGAVLCRSEADLNRLARRRAGEATDGPVDCQTMRAPTAITIVQRAGPGRTEVKPTDPRVAASGWTDAWLPEKAPANATAAR
ncbi:MAG TPA: hypothetical protein VGC82_04580 [Rhodopila sp.]|jgi:hypothetical protein